QGGTVGKWDELPVDGEIRNATGTGSLFDLFGESEACRTIPIVVIWANAVSEVEALETLFSDSGFSDVEALAKGITRDISLRGGNDGQRPRLDEYAGAKRAGDPGSSGFELFAASDVISVIAAPGVAAGYCEDEDWRDEADSIIRLMISHVGTIGGRMAIIDSAQGQSVEEVREMRAKLPASNDAAFYFPWIRIADPVTGTPVSLPPSGFVAGIYARTDIERGVSKSPANEIVRLAIGLETAVTRAQQDFLNPEGINCFRFFANRGTVLWGARTISAEPEWKYVNVRRYFGYLKRSLESATDWAVFEPNDEPLWGKVRRAVDDFLLGEWRKGAMVGNKPENAFFVRCDRSTMTQNDIDEGRLVCLVGVALIRPAEFVIIRIGQWTADREP
ncbi:MAG: phage tail sheath subtilisin-like domain-containing protein, partial [Gemmatimonadota bacterium]|nr:phage tail sheath subtilisin-like domain-containing protein [Gemmatimonadota bacterium]